MLRKTTDGNVTLDMPDFDKHMKWSLSTFTQLPESSGNAFQEELHLHTVFYIANPTESQMEMLKELSDTQAEFPPTQNMATLVFLYLLTQICGENLT